MTKTIPEGVTVSQKGEVRLFLLSEGSNMKRETNVKKLTYSALFLALAFVLPFFTGQIQQIGNMLCPMHIPVILCGFICGAPWGLLTGMLAPVLRSITLGMPVLFPNAACMAVELAVYGFISGLLYKVLPKTKTSVYIALIAAMICGRAAWGLAMFTVLGFDTAKFGFDAIIAATVTASIPGIILQLVLIPIIVFAVQKQEK